MLKRLNRVYSYTCGARGSNSNALLFLGTFPFFNLPLQSFCTLFSFLLSRTEYWPAIWQVHTCEVQRHVFDGVPDPQRGEDLGLNPLPPAKRANGNCQFHLSNRKEAILPIVRSLVLVQFHHFLMIACCEVVSTCSRVSVISFQVLYTGRLHFLTLTFAETFAEPKLPSKYLLKSKSEVISLSETWRLTRIV